MVKSTRILTFAAAPKKNLIFINKNRKCVIDLTLFKAFVSYLHIR